MKPRHAHGGSIKQLSDALNGIHCLSCVLFARPLFSNSSWRTIRAYSTNDSAVLGAANGFSPAQSLAELRGCDGIEEAQSAVAERLREG